MRTIEVCLTPDLIHQHDLKGKVVVVVDIFRATSCIVAGLANGVKSIKPVSEVEEAKLLSQKGYLIAGERGGQKIQGFDMGNSPFEYLDEAVKGKKIAISTTNGSRAIIKSAEAAQILIGSFLNLEALTEYILQLPQNIVIHCSGWKGTPNLEDTLFAGALIDECSEEMKSVGDSALLAHQLYIANHENLLALALTSSHADRLKGLGIDDDLELCMEDSKYHVVPKLVGGELVSF